jgi:peroxiredoxin
VSMRWLLGIIIGVVVFAATLFSVRYFHPPQSVLTHSGNVSKKQEALAKLPKAPDIKFVDEENKEHQLSQFKGKVVVLAFWATWCEPCLEELPSLKKAYEELHPKGLEVVAVNLEYTGPESKLIKEFWKSKSIPFKTYFDKEMLAALNFEVDALPATFVINRKGRIATSAFGSNDWSSDKAIELLKSLVDNNEN